jgi:hypothetical protein
MPAADVEQAALAPFLSQFIQLIPEYGPVPEVVPARRYLIEYFSGHFFHLVSFKSRLPCHSERSEESRLSAVLPPPIPFVDISPV